MIRRLVNLLTALSLLLLVAVVAMWVRSAFTSDVWTRVRVTRAEVITDYVVSREGGVLLRRTRLATAALMLRAGTAGLLGYRRMLNK